MPEILLTCTYTEFRGFSHLHRQGLTTEAPALARTRVKSLLVVGFWFGVLAVEPAVGPGNGGRIDTKAPPLARTLHKTIHPAVLGMAKRKPEGFGLRARPHQPASVHLSEPASHTRNRLSCHLPK